MTEPSGPNPAYSGGAIARLVAVHKREGEVARDRSPMLSRAWNRALRRAGSAFKGLNVAPGEMTIRERTSLMDGLDAMPEHGLVVALEDRDGHRGLLVLSHGMVDALIEVQTTGRVEARPLPPRPVTRIDEALTRDFVDLSLAAWTHETNGEEGRDWPERMVFGSTIPDRRQLPLLMPECGYHLLSARVAVGEEAPREAEVMMLLPVTAAAGADTRATGTAPGEAAQTAGQPAEWKDAMETAVQDAELCLNAVLMRTRRSLAEIERLEPGDLISFGPAELASVRLETPAGRHVATGRLGQVGGMRALRLAAPVGTVPVGGAMAAPGGSASAAMALPSSGFDAAPSFGAAPSPAGGPGRGALGAGGDLAHGGMDRFGAGQGDAVPPGPLDLPGPDLGPGGLPDPVDLAGNDHGLPDLPQAGGLDPLPMATPAPLDFAPQSAPFNLDDLPE
jgi:flagellar motor switch protein FliM